MIFLIILSVILLSMLMMLFYAGSFDQSNNAGAINLKMGGSALEEKSSFKMLALTFSSKLG